MTLVARPTFLGFAADTKPTYATMARLLVVIIGLFAAIASAATNILVRKLLNVPAMVTVFWLMVVSFSLSFPITVSLSTSKWPTSSGYWLMVFLMAGLGFSGQGFKTQGLKWEQAGIGSMMRNLDLVLAFIFQVTLLGEKLQVLSVIGATITLLASIGMGYLKVKQKQRNRLQSNLTSDKFDDTNDNQKKVNSELVSINNSNNNNKISRNGKISIDSISLTQSLFGKEGGDGVNEIIVEVANLAE